MKVRDNIAYDIGFCDLGLNDRQIEIAGRAFGIIEALRTLPDYSLII